MTVIYDDTNIFARIIRGEVPCTKVYEDEYSLAFHDVTPAAKVHVLVVPKNPYISMNDFVQKAEEEEIAAFFKAVQKVALLTEVAETGYRIISNHGANASQTVPHFHIHVLGGEVLGGLLRNDKHIR